jgi:ATP-dependent exoDNAse (exonuclease V) alpha subunit
VADELDSWNIPNKLKLHPWKKRIAADHALHHVSNFFRQAYDKGTYNPESDMILIPFNKALGTDELNKVIANHIARTRHKLTYEIVAGFNKHYFSVGEKILYEKEDAIITDIKRNPVFAGKHPQSPSIHLDYWGCLQESDSDSESDSDHHIEDSNSNSDSENDIDTMLEAIANSTIEDKVREASHIITIRMNGSEREIELKSAAEINSLLMAYALTVHKSQGSEWKKVFVVLHNSHNTMIQRELLYTACTRAREELYVICEPDSFIKGIQAQRIKGNTLEEKSAFFAGKLASGEEIMLTEMGITS